MKIVTILGARPQFIKAAVVSPLLRARHDEFIIHTGQHFDFGMSQVFFDELKIPEPDVNLGVGAASQAEQLSLMIPAVEKICRKRKPDFALVYGDTTSTLAGALGAQLAGIPVAHVESGARLFDRAAPEELNRVLTDHIATALFAASQRSVAHLAREGLTSEKNLRNVFLTGDVMLDLAKKTAPIAEKHSRALERFSLHPGGYIFTTIHRPRNVDTKQDLERIVGAFEQLSGRTVFPVHPRTEKNLRRFKLYKRLEKIPGMILCGPVSYLDACLLAMHAAKIITDSGGLHREAYFHGVPCIVVGRRTEWMELVDTGWSMLADFSRAGDARKSREFNPKGRRPPVFGHGNAGEKIVKALDSLEKR